MTQMIIIYNQGWEPLLWIMTQRHFYEYQLFLHSLPIAVGTDGDEESMAFHADSACPDSCSLAVNRSTPQYYEVLTVWQVHFPSIYFSVHNAWFLLKRTSFLSNLNHGEQTFATSTNQRQYIQPSGLLFTISVFILVTQQLTPHR